MQSEEQRQLSRKKTKDQMGKHCVLGNGQEQEYQETLLQSHLAQYREHSN